MRSDAMPSFASSLRQPDVPFGVGVPLRQHDDGAARRALRIGLPGKARTTVLFSGCGVVSALGNVSVPSSPPARRVRPA